MFGGGQWSLYYLIKNLNKERFQPVVLCPGEGELAGKMRTAGADVIFLNLGRIRHMNPLAVLKLILIIKKYGFNIIHTDATTETFYAGIAAKIMRVPLIWHIRVSESAGFLDKLLTSLSAKLILVAGAIESRFEWLGNKQKMVVIHNGVDLQEFYSFTPSTSIRKEFGIADSEILLACTGRIEERKGQEYLIDAMRHVDNAKLILFGKAEEEYLNHVKSLCKEYKLSDRVIFAGHRKDIPSLLREIDIFVFPVITGEGFSRAILEAMSAARPVIASDDAGNKEAVIDGVTGYIVPVRDSAALAAKVNELAGDREKRRKMGLAGRERVEKLFTIQKNVEEIEAVYETLVMSWTI